MVKQMGLSVLLVSCVACAQGSAQLASSHLNSEILEREASLSISALEIRQNRLELRYEITNSSQREIWLCDDVDAESSVDFEVVTDLQGSTLLIRLRLGVPLGWWRLDVPTGRYNRLMPGERYTAVLWLDLPVRQQPVFASRSAHHLEQEKYADRVILEVGYFSGNLLTRTASLVRDANEVQQRWQAEEDWYMKEEDRLEEKHRELSKKWSESADTAAKERLRVELDRLDLALGRLHNSLMSLNRTSLYLPSLASEIPVELFWSFEDIRQRSRDDRMEILIPYEYAREVDKEYFLRVVVEKVRVPHVPPRYLVLTERVPWGKKRLEEEEKAGASLRNTE
ncbi:MAG TPA: hypothetical protein VIN62_03565 [Candidatus Cryosericum sp.]